MQACKLCGVESPDPCKFCFGCGGELRQGSLTEPKPRLVFAEPAEQAPFELDARTLIGRLPTSTLQLTDPAVSKQHCVLESRDGTWVLRDLGSSNGTYVNQKRVHEEVALRHADVISLGSIRLRFETSLPWRSPVFAAPEPAGFGPALGAGFGAPLAAAPPSAPSVAPPGMRPMPPVPGPPPGGAGPAGVDATLPMPGPPNGISCAQAPPFSQASSVSVSSILPEAVAPNSEFLLEIVLHLAGYSLEGAPGFFTTHDLATLHLHAGAKLTVGVCLTEQQAAFLTLDEAEAQLAWHPPSSRASFRFKVAEGVPVGSHYVRVEVGAGGVRLCHFYIDLVVARDAKAPPRRHHALVRKMPSSAFASYASADRNTVCQRLESIQALGIDVFLDCLDIRQGEDWQQAVAEAAISKDVFLLFWSTAAKNSEWVKLEWESALASRGIDYIVPNALEPAHECPPPSALASLQFGSRFAFLRSQPDDSR